MKTLTIEFRERDAVLLIDFKVYDERGNFTGYLSEEDIKREQEECEGKIVIEATAFAGDLKTEGPNLKVMSVRSSRMPKEHKTAAILQVIEMIGCSYARKHNEL